jgi:alkanesulfonate monooxygenase SsuD/methylene tetrahydromethanopterin reductase-like flavin-dependent oxidoreductase (luciferase family)
MRIGLYVDLRNPPGWRRPWREHYARTLERLAGAEALGLASVWLTEHHLFEDGYLPQPLTFAAAVAARTTRMRIGTSVVLATLRPAIDVAEQAAVVDLVSGGRLELGIGAGYRIPEFAAYGVPATGRYETLEARGRELTELWNGGRLSPPPLQPAIPLWVGALGPRGARLAGRLGAGLLSLREDLLAPYREGLAACAGAPAPRLSGPVNLLIADDPEAAWARVKPYLAYQLQTYRDYGAQGREGDRGVVGSRPVDVERARSAGPDMNMPRFDVVTPAEAVRRLRAWLGPLPVEHAYFWESIAGMPEDLAQRHVELLATAVAPALSGA